MNADSLRIFEAQVAAAFAAGLVRGPVHLSDGNEEQLVEIFKGIRREDWVFSTYRWHFHGLLHGIDPQFMLDEIYVGHSISFKSEPHRFYTSAIVGGNLSPAVGVACAIAMRRSPEHVWCFTGDMAASIGTFHDAFSFAEGYNLPITFVVEDNGFSTNTPTAAAWGRTPPLPASKRIVHYTYARGRYPHHGLGKRVNF